MWFFPSTLSRNFDLASYRPSQQAFSEASTITIATVGFDDFSNDPATKARVSPDDLFSDQGPLNFTTGPNDDFSIVTGSRPSPKIDDYRLRCNTSLSPYLMLLG